MSEEIKTLDGIVQLCHSSRMREYINPLISNKGIPKRMLEISLPILNLKSKSSKAAEVISELSYGIHIEKGADLKKYRVTLPSN